MNLRTIARYHTLGFVIHPLCPYNHYCKSPGKIPWDPSTGKHMAGWQDHENYHMDTWDEWLDLEPEINLGMLCGSPSKLVGIDIDNEAGDEMISNLYEGGAWEYTTGKGRRLLFRYEEPLPKQILSDGTASVERLGNGSNNVLPPSQHAGGAVYAWVEGKAPKDIDEPAELPEWAFGQSSSMISDGEVNSDDIDWVRIMQKDLQVGQRNNVMTQIVGRLVGPAPMNAREATLLAILINHRYSDPPMNDVEIKSIVKSITNSEKRSSSANIARAREISRSNHVPFDAALQSIERGEI